MVCKHSYAPRPIPDSPGNLAEWIDQAAGAHFSLPGDASTTFQAYAASAMKRDPGLEVQLADQLRMQPPAVRQAARWVAPGRCRSWEEMRQCCRAPMRLPR